MNNIVLLCGFSGSVFRINNLAKLYKKKYPSLNINIFVMGKKNYEFLNNNNSYKAKIFFVEDLIYKFARSDLNKNFKFDFSAMNYQKIVFAERYFSLYTHNKNYSLNFSFNQIKFIVYNFDKILKEIFDKGVDFVYVYTSASFISEFLYIYCKRYSVKYYSLRNTRINNKYLLIDNNIDFSKELFHEYQRSDLKQDKNSEIIIQKFLSGSISDKKRLSRNLSINIEKKKISFKNILNFFFKLKYKEIHPIYNKSLKIRVLDIILYIMRKRYFIKNCSRILHKSKYVFFPLYVQPEASTLIRAPKYFDTLNLIKQISQNLPLDYKLVIKEHPAMVGNRSIFFYKEVNKIFNLDLVSHLEDNKKLIEGSSLVIVTTGTTGLEALLAGKKTIILGSSLFSIVKSSIKVDQISDIGKVLNIDFNKKKFDEQILDMKKFISALLNTIGINDEENIIWTHKRDEKIIKLNKIDYDLFNLLEKKNEK